MFWDFLSEYVVCFILDSHIPDLLGTIQGKRSPPLRARLAVAETVSFGPRRDPSGTTHYRSAMDFLLPIFFIQIDIKEVDFQEWII